MLIHSVPRRHAWQCVVSHNFGHACAEASEGMLEDEQRPAGIGASGEGATVAAAALSAVATAEPGMHDKHAWWRAAAAVLAAHFTAAHSPSSCGAAHAGETAPLTTQQSPTTKGVGGGPWRGAAHAPCEGGPQSEPACMGDAQHDVGLVLQRALMVAMVCYRPLPRS